MTLKRWLLIILIASTVAVHFAFFGHPNQTVFDEVYFGKFISSYYTHQYYFDIHPPLGKLIIAGFAKLFHYQPEYSFANIGQVYQDKMYMVLRFLPTLAGTLLPLIIFFLAQELGLGLWPSFLAAMFTTLDNALLTQSRYILLDSFLLLFGFSALLFYFKYRSQRIDPNFKSKIFNRNLFWMAILGGASASIKWTGLSFLGLAGLIELVDIVRSHHWLRTIKLGLYFILIPFILYFSVFMIHFALLTHSGDGDAFMTPAFRETLIGSNDYNNPTVPPLNIVQKFIELNHEMYEANKTLTATHPYSSKWYTWPLMIRDIYYWDYNHPGPDQIAEKIYLLGNPLIWWGSTAALLYLLIMMLQNLKSKIKKIAAVPVMLFGGYLINMLPFIGITRVMFLYHYLTGLIFAILILAYCVSKTKNPKAITITLIIIAAGLFLFFAPLSYGLPLSPHAFDMRMWLPSWR